MVELIPMSVAISGPLKEQWGYLFVNEFGKEADKQKHYRTLSHELGHGRTALPHTFKDDYIAKYTTNNLMDYVDPGSFLPNGGSGWEGATDLVRAQWDMVHNPAIFTPLQSDGDGAVITKPKKGTIVGYVISSSDARIRNNTSPYSFQQPKEIIEKGKEVTLVKTLDVKLSIVSVKYLMGATEYVTSKSNIKEIIKLTANEKYKLLSDQQSVILPYSSINTGNISKMDTYVTVDKACGDYYQVKVNTTSNEGWWILRTALKRVDKDDSDNFDDLAKVSIINGVVDSENLAKVIANRNNINDRTDSDIYSKTLSWVTKDKRSGYQYIGYDNSQPTITEGTDFEKYVIGIMLKELHKEGSYSSINAYDGEVFTWGKGFSVKGKLMSLIEALLNTPNKDYAQIFANVGILIVDKHFWVLDESGNWKKDSPPSYEASNYIKTNTKLLSFFIELAQKEDYSGDVMTAQYNIVKDDGPLDFPTYILVSEKTGYADSWNDASVTVLCHLSHWSSASYGWHKSGNSYQDTKGDLAKVLYKYLYESVKGAKVLRKGEVIETNIYEWYLYYNVLDKFHEFGIPLSIGETTLNETWNAHTLILTFKNDTNGKLRAVCNVDGKQKYINNSESVLLKKDVKYLIVTNNANTIIYEDFK